jgi:hypothetical protein
VERKEFIIELIALQLSDEKVVELTILGYKDSTVEEVKNQLAVAKSEIRKEEKNEPEKILDPIEKSDVPTIHSILIGGLRLNKTNSQLLDDLKKHHSTVDEKKLKQRVYEYRYHYIKGKIK